MVGAKLADAIGQPVIIVNGGWNDDGSQRRQIGP
jgi:hypothetical protein